MAIAEEFAQGPTFAHAATKELAHIAVNAARAAGGATGMPGISCETVQSMSRSVDQRLRGQFTRSRA
jgi:hypothetical protein